MTRFSPTTIRAACVSAVALAVASAAPAPAQPPLPENIAIPEGLGPFRNPTQHVERPEDLFRDLQIMVNLAENPGEYDVEFDDEGIEVCTHPQWQTVRERVKGKMFNMSTVFGIILRDSRYVNDRKLAAYGTFYCGKPDHIVQLISFFPGEPVREIRQEAYRRAVAFLRVHLPKDKRPTAKTPKGAPLEPLYNLEAGGYVGLIRLDNPKDQAQGLWFLGQLCAIRPSVGRVLLHYTRKDLRRHLVAKDKLVRQHAREFAYHADPKRRRPPKTDAEDEEILTWFDAILYDVFPPIRKVSAGRTDLYPSADLEKLAKIGRDLVERDALGETVQGKARGGRSYRGLRVARWPSPLDKLRIPAGAVILSVNRQPTPTAQKILTVVEQHARRGAVMYVEYVHKERLQMMEFRLQK